MPASVRGTTALTPFDQLVQQLAQNTRAGVLVMRTSPPIEIYFEGGNVVAARFDTLGEADAFVEAVLAPPVEYEFTTLSPEELQKRLDGLPAWTLFDPPAQPSFLILEAITRESAGELAAPRMQRVMDNHRGQVQASALFRGMELVTAKPNPLPPDQERVLRAIRRAFSGTTPLALQIQVGKRLFALVSRGTHTLVMALAPERPLEGEALGQLART